MKIMIFIFVCLIGSLVAQDAQSGIDLKEVVADDDYLLDIERGLNVQFSAERGTYILPNEEISAFEINTRMTTKSIQLPDLEACSKIVFANQEIMVIMCKGKSALVDLKSKAVLSIIEDECLNYVSKDSTSNQITLICQSKDNLYFYYTLIPSEKKLHSSSRLKSELPFVSKDTISLKKIYSNDTHSYFWSQPSDYSKTDILNHAIILVCENSDPDKFKKFEVDRKEAAEVVKAKLEANGETIKSELTIRSISHIYVMVPEGRPDHPKFLVSVFTSDSFNNDLEELYVLEGELSEDEALKVKHFRTVDELYSQSPHGTSVIESKISSKRVDENDQTKWRHSVTIKVDRIKENKTNRFGLFEVVYEYTEDYNLKLGDIGRKGPIVVKPEKPSLLNKYLEEGKPKSMVVQKIMKGLTVYGLPSSKTGYLIGVKLPQDFDQFYYTKANDFFHYGLENGEVYALRSELNSMSLKGKGSEILHFEKSCKNSVTIKPSSKNAEVSYNIKYVLMGASVSTEKIIMKVSSENIKLKSSRAADQVTKFIYPALNGRSEYWFKLPFDNEMISGQYLEMKVIEPQNTQVYVRMHQPIKVVDEFNIELGKEKMIILDGYTLEPKGLDNYIIRKCMEFESSMLVAKCSKQVSLINSGGKIERGTQSNEHLFILLNKGGKKSFSILNLADGSLLISIPLCEDIQDFSYVVFGHSVWYAVNCGGKKVDVFNYHLNNPSKAPESPAKTYDAKSTPKVECPRKIHIRKDKKVKISIYNECEGSMEGNVIDSDVTGKNPDDRVIKSFAHDLNQFSLKSMCAHGGKVVVQVNSKLYLFKVEGEFVSQIINLGQITDVTDLICLSHGRIAIVGGSQGLLADIDTLDGMRNKPFRLIRDIPLVMNPQFIIETEDSVIFNLEISEYRYHTFSYDIESPSIFVKLPIAQDLEGKSMTVQVSDIRQNGVSVKLNYKLQPRKDYIEKLEFKTTQGKVKMHEGQLFKLKSEAGLTLDGELWKVSVEGSTEAARQTIQVKQAVRFIHNLATGIQTFSHSKGGIVYVQADNKSSKIYYEAGAEQELFHELSIGDYCIDSDINHLGIGSWYAVFSCFNEHSTYLVYLSSAKSDLRISEVSDYNTDVRVRLLQETNVYLFTRLPHKTTLLIFHSQNPKSEAPAQFMVKTDVLDYEVVTVRDTLYMIWTGVDDEKVRVAVVHSKDAPKKFESSELSVIDYPVQAFRCKEDIDETFTCAFSIDSYKINLVTMKVDADGKISISKQRSLKVYKNMVGMKIDFDDKLLAVSGSFFLNDADTQTAFERLEQPAVVVYNLKDNTEFLTGHIELADLGFNPSAHNHDLRIVQYRTEEPYVGIRGTSMNLGLYTVSEPELSFGRLLKQTELNDLSLRLNGVESRAIAFSDILELAPEQKKEEEKKDEIKKEPSGGYWKYILLFIIIVIIAVFGVLWYLRNKIHEQKMRYTNNMEGGLNDSSIFDKSR